jgi:hypothetical protein
MTLHSHTTRSVRDGLVDLINAAEEMEQFRAEADRAVAELEARWAKNRETNNAHHS